MDDEPRFAPHLYRGTAEAYDGFRLGYPPVMTDDLLGRVAPSGRGRLLDLACGTGQLAFALGHAFAEVWAVDQEPDMVRVVAAKAAATGRGHVRAVVSPAEELGAPPGRFELVTVGNAFHRLRRDVTARRAYEWLSPGGHLALCWSDPPWEGAADWQHVLAEALGRWRSQLRITGRVPQGWEGARRERPDLDVLVSAGFATAGRHGFAVEHRWTLGELIGFVYSTSVLPFSVVAGRAAAFEADLAARLGPCARDGTFSQAVGFAYDLVRRPRSC